MTEFLQQLINGLSLGAIYALIALGYTMVYGVLRRWQPAQFRATLQGYFLIASMVGMAGYALTGLWTRAVTSYFLLSLPLALIAIFLGHAVHRRLSSRRFLICVNVGLALIGGLLLKQAFHA